MAAGTEIIVCTTCRGPGRTDGVGAALAARLTALATDTAVAVVPIACLWSCDRGASAQLRHPAKTGYVLGGLVATDAGAVFDFAVAHAATATGEVPYDRWPAGVLGHFIARTPPPGGTFS